MAVLGAVRASMTSRLRTVPSAGCTSASGPESERSRPPGVGTMHLRITMTAVGGKMVPFPGPRQSRPSKDASRRSTRGNASRKARGSHGVSRDKTSNKAVAYVVQEDVTLPNLWLVQVPGSPIHPDPSIDSPADKEKTPSAQ
ncbi:hypothetical protein ColLi_08558 [Colletotrichum liriopes]|uniref:Uncharacterized protein n=1 Tax=Colletotrichum liriopes TaxID=708192 RepID=A0AA37LUD4_9PEZI|nr:hypothetical protein ColLi_08558 [Colletotrichum liriopes]